MNKLCVWAAYLTLALLTAASPAWASGSGIVTFDVAVQGAKGGMPVRLWMPYPLFDGYQDISQVRVSGTYDATAVYRDAKNGAVYLFAEWDKTQQTPNLRFAFHVDSHFMKGPQLKDGNALPKCVGDVLPVDVQLPYLLPVLSL